MVTSHLAIMSNGCGGLPASLCMEHGRVLVGCDVDPDAREACYACSMLFKVACLQYA